MGMMTLLAARKPISTGETGTQTMPAAPPPSSIVARLNPTSDDCRAHVNPNKNPCLQFLSRLQPIGYAGAGAGIFALVDLLAVPSSSGGAGGGVGGVVGGSTSAGASAASFFATAAGIAAVSSVGVAVIGAKCLSAFKRQSDRLNQANLMAFHQLKIGDKLDEAKAKSLGLSLDQLIKLNLVSAVKPTNSEETQWVVCDLDNAKKSATRLKKITGITAMASSITAGALAGFAIGGPAGAAVGGLLGMVGAYFVLNALHNVSKQHRDNQQMDFVIHRMAQHLN